MAQLAQEWGPQLMDLQILNINTSNYDHWKAKTFVIADRKNYS